MGRWSSFKKCLQRKAVNADLKVVAPGRSSSVMAFMTTIQLQFIVLKSKNNELILTNKRLGYRILTIDNKSQLVRRAEILSS